MTEVWFRNPGDYIREVKEAGESNLVFDFGWLHKRKFNPHPWISAHFGLDNPYRLILCGPQGSPEFAPHTENPIAVYPTWEYSEDISELETFMAYNVGDDPNLTDDESIPADQRYRPGQEHRVFVTGVPRMELKTTKVFLRLLAAMQKDNPQCIMHLHGGNTFATPIRLEYGAFDWNPRLEASHGNFFIHNGKYVRHSEGIAKKFARELTVLGYVPKDTMIARNRCIINIKASVYMAAHFGDDDNLLMQRRDGASIDVNVPEKDFLPVVAASPIVGRRGTEFGDKIVCDECSLSKSCRQYVPEGICTLPGTEGKKLADFFETRDIESIKNGYAGLIKATAERFDMGRENEVAHDELDPAVTRIGTSLGGMLEKFAKIIDPKLNGGAVQVNVGRVGGSDQHLTIDGKEVSPDQLLRRAMNELIEANGGKMEGITESMVRDKLLELSPSANLPVPAMPFVPTATPVIIEG